MTKPNLLPLLALTALLAAGGAQAGLVLNPSFESNYNETWPHYGAVDMWAGASGVNDVTGPFHNTVSAIPDQTRVGFKQGAGAVSQDITGLTPGQPYWLQFWYDARDSSIKVDITASFNGVDIDKVVNVQPAHSKNLPYYFASFPFTPDVDSGTLAFTVAVTGDSTALFDGVNIVQRDTNNVTVANPSFEASGDIPGDGTTGDGITTGAIAGWTCTGTYGINKTDGSQPYADNGTPPEQDHVAVLGDSGTFSQTVNGITPGKPYQIAWAYNAKSGTTPHLQLKVGDTLVYEENVTAVGGTNPYKTKTVTFTAADFSANITFAQTGTGTLLLDDVKVLGEAATPLPPLTISPNVAEISPGDQVTLTVTVPNTLLLTRALDIKLRSLSPAVARVVGADSDGVITLHFDKGGDSSKTFVMQGVRRGSAVLDVVDSASLKVVDTSTIWVVTSFVKNPSFESAAAPSGVGYGEILGWTGGSGVNAAGAPFLDNGAIPDRVQVGFIQNSKSLSQNISGLNPGQTYWLQFAYNARAFGTGWNLDLSVKFAGNELVKIPGIQAAGAVGDMAPPFWFTNILFTPTSSSGLLEFATTVTGDATLLLDGINIVERDAVDIVVENPSFEASGTIFSGVGYMTGTPMLGWAFSGSGYGVNVPGRDPWFSDNGVNPDQQTVLFIQNAGSVSQTIHGLTAGNKYTLVIWANPRNCCTAPNNTMLRVSVDDSVVFEESLPPVGNPNPYAVRQVSFTAGGPDAVLKLEHAPEAGDFSIVVDNVRIVPDGKIPPIILTQPQSSTQLLVGDSVTLTGSAMGTEPLTYQWQLNGTNLAGKTSETLDLTGLTAQQSGEYRLLVHNSVSTKSSQPAVIKVHQKVASAFNTGVLADGTLAPAGTVDLNYTLVDNPNDATSKKAYIIANAPDTWVVNTETAQWIGPAADPQAEPQPNVGFYKYRLSFDLTGYDPANTFVSGGVACAQGLDDIYLNDQIYTGYRNASQPGTLAPFLLTSGFKAGVNTLDFRVYVTSAPQPAGLLVTDLKIGAQTGGQIATVKLTVELSGGQVKMAWPVAATGYLLQSSAKVDTGWADDGTAAVQQVDQWVVNVTTTGTTGKFYRLIKR